MKLERRNILYEDRHKCKGIKTAKYESGFEIPTFNNDYIIEILGYKDIQH